MAVHNALVAVWLDLNFGTTKELCTVCDGFDPLEIPQRKVYNIRGGMCLEHILEQFAEWVNEYAKTE